MESVSTIYLGIISAAAYDCLKAVIGRNRKHAESVKEKNNYRTPLKTIPY